MNTLPAIPMTDDLVDRIAKEVAAQVADHIETMYPRAADAVAWASCRRSIQGVVRNNIASAGRAATDGTIEDWLVTRKDDRRKFKAQWRRNKET